MQWNQSPVHDAWYWMFNGSSVLKIISFREGNIFLMSDKIINWVATFLDKVDIPNQVRIHIMPHLSNLERCLAADLINKHNLILTRRDSINSCNCRNSRSNVLRLFTLRPEPSAFSSLTKLSKWSKSLFEGDENGSTFSRKQVAFCILKCLSYATSAFSFQTLNRKFVTLSGKPPLQRPYCQLQVSDWMDLLWILRQVQQTQSLCKPHWKYC